jgi:hypothetical protein
MTLTEVELAWAAGLFEGEGAIKIDRASAYQCRLMVALRMTDLDIVCFFHERWGGSFGPHKVRPECRPQWSWAVVSRMAGAFLEDVSPYFRSPRVREKAAVALAFQGQKRAGNRTASEFNQYRSEQWAYWAEMRDLNRRGVA